MIMKSLDKSTPVIRIRLPLVQQFSLSKWSKGFSHNPPQLECSCARWWRRRKVEKLTKCQSPFSSWLLQLNHHLPWRQKPAPNEKNHVSSQIIQIDCITCEEYNLYNLRTSSSILAPPTALCMNLRKSVCGVCGMGSYVCGVWGGSEI